MNTKFFISLFTILACFSAFSISQPSPINVKSANSGPQLDGVLDDDFWKDIPEIKTFHVLRSAVTVDDTVVKIGSDGKWLYLGIMCAHPEADKLEHAKVEHDGNVLASDSLEILIDSKATGQSYCEFMVNCGNDRAERRIINGSREDHWNPPWRSRTMRLPNGWSAEIAIPLFILEKEEALDSLTINIGRNQYIPSGELTKRVWSCMAPADKSFHEYEKFIHLKNVVSDGNPFLPVLRNIETSKWRLSGDHYQYDLSAELENASKTSGDPQVKITNISKIGEKKVFSKNIALTGKGKSILTIPVSVPTPDASKIIVEMFESERDNFPIFATTLDNPSSLQALSVRLDRSYYTSEKQATAICASTIPPQILNELKMVVRSAQGTLLAESSKHTEKWKMEIPLKSLPNGDNIVTFEYRAGAITGERRLVIRKEPPNPNGEIKIDQINCRLLKNGTPFFPICLTVYRGTENLYKQASEAGFNTFILCQQAKVEAFKANTETAAKSELSIISYLPRFATNNFRKTYVWLHQGKITSKDVQKFLAANIKSFESIVKTGRDTPELLAYLISQPGQTLPEQNESLADIVNSLDPYHPTMILFHRLFDATTRELSYADIITFDPFWGYTIFDKNKVYQIAKFAGSAVKLAESIQKPLIIAPFSSFWNANAQKKFKPVPAVYKCLMFLSVVNGAQGVNICYNQLKNTPESWPGIQEAAKSLHTALPFLTGPAISTKTSYSPLRFNPEHEEFPPVMATLRKSSKGDFAILATNCQPNKAKVKFKIDGLPNDTINELCRKTKHTVTTASFIDEIEPYGVRVYRLGVLPERKTYKLLVEPPRQ